MSAQFIPSQNLSRIAPSATMAMSRRAKDMQRAGIDVVDLSAGEPDFDTPENIKRAAMDAMAAGKTGYTVVDGIAELKAAIIRKFERENGLKYQINEINVSPGGKPVIFNALAATLNPGDEVIIPAPCWVSYPEMVTLCGGVPRVLKTDAAQSFKITPTQLSAAITPRTRWLMLNSPSNPTGAVYSAAELKALAQILLRHEQVWVLSDDIYEHLLYTDAPFATMAQVEPALKDRTLTMNGVSKAYAMTGWRIGYAGGPAPLIGAMAKVMSQTTSNPSSISQWAAVEALDGPQDFLAPRCAAFADRREKLIAGLNAISGLRCAPPDGAFYAFASCEALIGKRSEAGALIGNDTDLCNALLEEAHLALVPGSAFHAPAHIRLSYAASQSQLDEALRRLFVFCAGLR